MFAHTQLTPLNYNPVLVVFMGKASDHTAFTFYM